MVDFLSGYHRYMDTHTHRETDRDRERQRDWETKRLRDKEKFFSIYDRSELQKDYCINVLRLLLKNYHKLGDLTGIYSLTVLESSSLELVSLGWNQGASRARITQEALGVLLVSPSFWWLLIFLGLWLHGSNFSLRGHRAFSSLYVKSSSASLI